MTFRTSILLLWSLLCLYCYIFYAVACIHTYV